VTRLASNLVEGVPQLYAETDPVLAGGATEATFELRKGGATTGEPITINADNNSLEGLRDAVNAADAGVTASLVDVTATARINCVDLERDWSGRASRTG